MSGETANAVEICGVHFARLDKDETALVEAIIDRAQKLGLLHADWWSLQLDLHALHHHTPLDLQKLADAPDFTFIHDIGGIQANMDRQTGQLLNHFLPRCMRVAS